MGLIQEISEYLQKGKAKNVKALVQQALDENMDPKEILNDGLLAGMMAIGTKFKNNEVFVPEVLVAASAPAKAAPTALAHPAISSSHCTVVTPIDLCLASSCRMSVAGVMGYDPR